MRAVCGSKGFESPSTHKGPQRGAFIVKVSLNKFPESAAKPAQIGWRGLIALPPAMPQAECLILRE